MNELSKMTGRDMFLLIAEKINDGTESGVEPVALDDELGKLLDDWKRA